MARIQIQLTRDQQAKLKALAAERGTSLAGLIREGVHLVLQRAEEQRKWKRLWTAVGSCRETQGANDVAERHDSHLAEIYRSDERFR